MATDKQIKANQRNAKKSTGPRTSAGKARCAQNGARHSQLAKSVLLRSECPKRFTTFVATFYSEHGPTTATEYALVDTMASARWRIIRLTNLEAATVDTEYPTDLPASPSGETDIPALVAMAYCRALADSRSLGHMNRAEARLQRQFDSALKSLHELRWIPWWI